MWCVTACIPPVRVLQCVAVCCSVLQFAAVYCSVLQCVSVCCSDCNVMRFIVYDEPHLLPVSYCAHTRKIFIFIGILNVFRCHMLWRALRCCHCNTLQHTATHCNTLLLQRTATHDPECMLGLSQFLGIFFCFYCRLAMPPVSSQIYIVIEHFHCCRQIYIVSVFTNYWLLRMFASTSGCAIGGADHVNKENNRRRVTQHPRRCSACCR